MLKKFDLTNKTAIVTGGSGLLGKMHCEALAETGANVIIFDLNLKKGKNIINKLKKKYKSRFYFFLGDVTLENNLIGLINFLKSKKLTADILVNNAAYNPKFNKNNSFCLEKFTVEDWDREINIGLTGVFLCSKVIGSFMKIKKSGVIINISSDLGLIAPNQNIYKINKNNNFRKPITYSVIKHGIIGITKYLSTYWSDYGIRANCLCPGGVYEKQNKIFLKNISQIIPMKRLAEKDEYKSAIQFLASDASSYMNGANLVIDGGRTAW